MLISVPDEGLQAPISSELLTLLLTGNASPPLQQWLLNTLNEQGLKRLKKGIEMATADILQFSIKHIKVLKRIHTSLILSKRAGEQLFFRLSEMQALSKWSVVCWKNISSTHNSLRVFDRYERFGVIGLEEQTMDDCVQRAAQVKFLH